MYSQIYTHIRRRVEHHDDFCTYHANMTNKEARPFIIQQYDEGLTHEQLAELITRLKDWEYVKRLRIKTLGKLQRNGHWPWKK